MRKAKKSYKATDINCLFNDVIDFLPDATFVIDNEKRVVIWNNALEIMTGILSSEMIGKGNYEYTIPFHGEARAKLIDLLFQEDPL
ncbi:MAG: PAS domain-containing protein, partial [Peptostreptococcaceae bacterium]|nr:PAS domain-containing protein [Peptostreptococcaceae bacterium]